MFVKIWNQKNFCPCERLQLGGFAIFFLVLTLGYFIPALSSLGYTIPSTYPDGNHFVWNFWWVSKYLRGEVPALDHSSLVYHPFGTELYLHTLTEGVVVPASLIGWGLQPAVLYTLSCIVIFFLNGVAAYRLFRLFAPSKPLIVRLVTVLFVFHPFFIGHLDGGHLNFLAIFPVLIFGEITVRMFQSSQVSWKAVVLSGACIAWLAIINLYYLYYLAIASLVYLLCFVFSRRKDVLRKGAAVLYPFAVGAALSAPYIFGVMRSALSGEFTPNHDPAGHSAALEHYFFPGMNQLLGGYFSVRANTLNTAESGLYIGYGVLLALTILLMRSARVVANTFAIGAVAIGALFFVLALGPQLYEGVSNPVYDAFSWLPLFPSVPARFFIMGELFLFAALLHLANHQCAKVSGLLGFCVLVSAIEFFPVPLRVAEFGSSPVLEALRNSEVKAIHDASQPIDLVNRNQVFHGKRVTRAYLARRPRKILRFYRNNQFLSLLDGRLKKDPFPDELKRSWEELRIDGVLVPRGEAKTLAKLSSITWLQLSMEDSTFLFFTVIT